jgi:exosortase A-associated hydrolase 1
MTVQQQAFRIRCGDSTLFGVAHLPPQPSPRGLVVVTGGPQYRVGSHRQFVLLARHLAAQGIPVLRFDYRGMGDSEGAPRTFEQAGEDVHSAVDYFFQLMPEMKELVLWGLCDGATAAAFHAARDPRVHGLVMLNPWVRTGQGAARTVLRYYYFQRVLEREFWSKLMAGALGWRRTLTEVMRLGAQAAGSGVAVRGIGAPQRTGSASVQVRGIAGDLPQRLYSALHSYSGRILIILSGADLTAREFATLASGSPQWRRLLAHPRVRQAHIPEANHTFGRAAWRDQVSALCAEWIASW